MESKVTVEHAIMKEVVKQLREVGFEAAAYEYPGYISIGKRSYGTANGSWGWNDEDGNGGETDLGGECAQPDLIVAEIVKIERHQLRIAAEEINDKTFLDQVAAELNMILPEPVNVQHTGGGIFCIVIVPAKRVELYFGTSAENWGCDIYVDDEFIDGESINSPFAIDYKMPHQAAQQIAKILRNFQRDQMAAIIAKVDKRITDKKDEKEFQNAVQVFVAAAGDLVKAWEQLPSDSNFQNGKETHYPFNKSFDELYHDILDWSFQITSVKI